MEKDIVKRVGGWIKAAVYCHNVVNYNVLGVLVTCFTLNLKKDTIRRSALLENVREGLEIQVKAWAYARRSGFRKIIIFSTAAYILGLVMFYLSASNRIPNTSFGLYMFLSVLIAVGKAGGVSFLKTYLLDELIAGHENISDINYNRAQRRTNIWLSPAGVLVVFATPLNFDESWSRMFLNSMYMVGAASFLSFCGSLFSHQRHHPNTKTESTKRHRKYPDTSDEYHLKNDHQTLPPDQPFNNDGNQLPESSPTAGAEAQQKSPSLCSVKQENVGKLLLRMIPMWSAFIVFGLVMSTADTFFSVEHDIMDDQIDTSYFLLAKDVLKVVSACLSKFLVSRRISRSQQNLALKMIICLGMTFSVLCPSFAWQVEVQRLKIVHESRLHGVSEGTKVPMSDLWLASQFCLWGLAEGLAISGLDEFFGYHVSKSMEDYGSEVFNTIPIGIGSFLSVVCVSACGGWFGNTLNQSRLDNYYRMITIVAWINLCWFFFVSTFYSTKEEVEDEGIQLQEIIAGVG
ncbi:protein NRT1/ PTR FAMILY 5.7-like isoform X2 [Vitis riparia]|uniref:protein NRT1/ PTR FAMILY 5.7-like isoform X2 n=1 Tax=Vitis riparia TaxID=96939 RepID=UPI00155A53EB|nr:protein NRT1/ PTR FAMILY 5.7-like isoform X2 [Vitis riparia]